MHLQQTAKVLCCLFGVLWGHEFAPAQEAGPAPARTAAAEGEILTEQQWQAVDKATERALAWLAESQNPDGSFPTTVIGQPGVTSFCVLAFASQGHLPGEGPYGDKLNRAVGFIVKTQKENGMISLVAPLGESIARPGEPNESVYNHGISALTLSELYGMTGGSGDIDTRAAIDNAIAATLAMQGLDKRRPLDEGGWRYLVYHNLDEEAFDSDLSVTGWQLMFLRSAKNAGFDVPKQAIDDAVEYVKQCYSKKYGTFQLMATKYDRRSRGMAGAGVLAFAHAGYHRSPEAQAAGEWILKNDFNDYNRIESFGRTGWVDDRYHYGLFCCSQAMYQLGGKYWSEFFPPTVRTLLANQAPAGNWQPESHSHDTAYGNCYTTALVVLSLSAPNQLLPILQR